MKCNRFLPCPVFAPSRSLRFCPHCFLLAADSDQLSFCCEQKFSVLPPHFESRKYDKNSIKKQILFNFPSNLDFKMDTCSDIYLLHLPVTFTYYFKYLLHLPVTGYWPKVLSFALHNFTSLPSLPQPMNYNNGFYEPIRIAVSQRMCSLPTIQDFSKVISVTVCMCNMNS